MASSLGPSNPIAANNGPDYRHGTEADYNHNKILGDNGQPRRQDPPDVKPGTPGWPTETVGADSRFHFEDGGFLDLDAIYKVNGSSLDLFQSQPYAFAYHALGDTAKVTELMEQDRFVGSEAGIPGTLRPSGQKINEIFYNKIAKHRIIYLPINPSNLTISTSFANALTPTLYGTVEERSRVRYYKIDIQGTTGTVAKWSFDDSGSMSSLRYVGGRGSYQKDWAQKAMGAVNNLTGGLADKVLGGAVSSINGVIGSLVGKKPKEGYELQQSGYKAFHDLYRFLLRYQREASEGRTNGGLKFKNFKDGNQYLVSPQSFTLVRDASQPMMYNYSISLMGYDMTQIYGQAALVDQSSHDMAKILGLDGVESSGLYSGIKNVVGSSTRALGAIGGLFR